MKQDANAKKVLDVAHNQDSYYTRADQFSAASLHDSFAFAYMYEHLKRRCASVVLAGDSS